MEKKKKKQDEAPRYNLKLQSSKNQKHPYPHPICTPPFCDKLSKGNQDSSSKGGGGVDRRKLTISARKV